MSRRRIMQNQVHGGDLPSGYVRCKYLESSGTQYIDTLVFSKFIHADIDFEYTGITDKNQFIIGRLPDYKYAEGIFIRANEITVNGILRTESIISTKFTIGDRVFCKMKEGPNSYFYANEINYITDVANSIGIARSIYLFDINNVGKPFQGAKAKLYSATLRDNDESICMNAVPYLDPSGRPCMYDTVTQKPFYNQGTGEFGYELPDGTYVAPI